MVLRLHGGAAIVLSPRAAGTKTGACSSLSAATSIRSVFAGFAAKALTTRV